MRRLAWNALEGMLLFGAGDNENCYGIPVLHGESRFDGRIGLTAAKMAGNYN